MVLECTGVTDPGCVRKNNEDTFRIVEELGLYVIADGMGGAQAGEYASKLAAGAVVEYLQEKAHNGLDPEHSAEELLKAFDYANRVVIDAASQHLHLEGMGTTLIAALANGDELYIASVGDSRV